MKQKRKLLALLVLLCLLLMGTLPCANAEGSWGTVTEKALAVRTGPGTRYTEPSNHGYCRRGDRVKIVSRVWDNVNSIWWFQCDITDGQDHLRLYTGHWRFGDGSYDLNSIPIETPMNLYATVKDDVAARHGPCGEGMNEYNLVQNKMVYGSGYTGNFHFRPGQQVRIITEEDGWYQVELQPGEKVLRCWVWWTHLNFSGAVG